MGVRRDYYTFTILVLVIFILVHMGDGRPVAAGLIDGAPSFVENTSPTNVLVATTVDHIDHPSVAVSLSRTENPTYSSTINSTQMSKFDRDATVAVSTIVGIVFFLPLLIFMLMYPRFIAGHQVDVFHSMRRTVYHRRSIAAPRPTSNARGYMPRTSLRNANPVSGNSCASTECAVPTNEVLSPQKPVPVLVKDTLPAVLSTS